MILYHEYFLGEVKKFKFFSNYFSEDSINDVENDKILDG